MQRTPLGKNGNNGKEVSPRVPRRRGTSGEAARGANDQIAKDFGISDATPYEWMKKADVEDGVRPGLSEADAQEMRELKRRNRVLEQEVEILRRATAYFAKDHSPK
jgi:transposase